MSSPEFSGQEPNAGEQNRAEAAAERWRAIATEAPLQELGRVEDAAKQLITLTGTLQGFYLAVFAFSDLRKQVTHMWLLMFFLPVALWLTSQFFATLTFLPRVRKDSNTNDLDANAWLALRRTYTETVGEKLCFLHLAHGFLVASFAALLALLVVVTQLPAPAEPGPTRVLVITPTAITAPTPLP